MENVIPSIGSKLREIRLANNATMEEVAGVIEVTTSGYQHLEYGARMMKVEYLQKFAKHYDVSADYLLGLSDEKQPIKGLDEFCEYTGLTKENAMFMHCNPEKAAIANELIAVFAKGFREE